MMLLIINQPWTLWGIGYPGLLSQSHSAAIIFIYPYLEPGMRYSEAQRVLYAPIRCDLDVACGTELHPYISGGHVG